MPWTVIHLTQTCQCQVQGSARTMFTFSMLRQFSLCRQHSRGKGSLKQLTVRHPVLSQVWFVTQSGPCSAGQHSAAAACREQGSTAARTRFFGTNLLVCTEIQILCLLLFYMTQSCCCTLYFDTAPSLGANTQESEYSCIPVGFFLGFLRLFCALKHS